MTKLIHHSSLRMKKSKRYLFSFIHHSPFFILMRILYDITYSLLTPDGTPPPAHMDEKSRKWDARRVQGKSPGKTGQ